MQGGPWSATNRPTSAEIAELWQHDVQWCIETFGAARCMFESNAPIEGPVADYRTLWNALKRIAAGYSDSEKNGLFHDNATRIYLSRGEVES
jgi:predicted TIM-barrel fold metal-dependent hydrolase